MQAILPPSHQPPTLAGLMTYVCRQCPLPFPPPLPCVSLCCSNHLMPVQQKILGTYEHTTRAVTTTWHRYQHVGTIVHRFAPLAQHMVEPKIQLIICEVLLRASGCIASRILWCRGRGREGWTLAWSGLAWPAPLGACVCSAHPHAPLARACLRLHMHRRTLPMATMAPCQGPGAARTSGTCQQQLQCKPHCNAQRTLRRADGSHFYPWWPHRISICIV
jgi:hypothetical protein